MLSSSLATLAASLIAIQAPAAAEGPVDDAPVERADVDEAPIEYENPIAEALAPVPGGLTADEVARKAVQSSPDVEIKAQEIAKAVAKIDQTIVSYTPTLSGKAGYTRLSPAAIDFDFGSGASVGALNEGLLTVGPCPQDPASQCVLDGGGAPVGAQAVDFNIEIPLNSFTLQAQLSVPLSDYVVSLLPAYKGSKAQRRAAELAHEAERIKAETDARLAYYDWTRTVATTVVARESVTRSQARLEDAQASYEAGAASKVDVLRLDAQLAAAEALVVDAEAAERLTSQRLSTMMGDDDVDPRFAIGEDVVNPPAPPAGLDRLDRLIDEAHKNRRELRSLYSTTDALEYGIRSTRAGYYPRLDAFAEATYANPNQRFFPQQSVWNGSWSVGVQLTYTINSAVMTRMRVREYKAEKRILELTAEKLRRGVTLEVSQAYHDRRRAMTNLALDARRVEAAEEAYRVATERFRAGQATTVEVILAELDLVNAQLQAINTRISLRAANARLLYSTGRLEPA
ncbi:MAG: TolC family protein [Nannocystaceae bacterium]|nr:TolC family protein [Myxococcales bacterium]